MKGKAILLGCLICVSASANPINLVPKGANMLLVSSTEVFEDRLQDDVARIKAEDKSHTLCAHLGKKLVRWVPARLQGLDHGNVEAQTTTYEAKQPRLMREGITLEDGTYFLKVFPAQELLTALKHVEVLAYSLVVTLALHASILAYVLMWEGGNREIREERDMLLSSAFHLGFLGPLTTALRWYVGDEPQILPVRYALPVLASELWCE